MNTAAIPYNRAVSRCVRSSRAWRERSGATLYSSTERLLVPSSHNRRASSPVVAAREHFDERCTPRPSGFRAFLAQPSGVIVSRGRRASGSTNAVLLDRAVSGPSSHGRLALSSVVAARERLDERCTPRPSGFRAFLAQPSGVIVSRGGAAAARRSLYSSSERLPGLPRSTVLRHRQSWRRASGSANAVFLVRAAPGLASSSVVAAARAAWTNAVFLVRAAPVPGVAISRGRRAGGSANAVFLVRAASPRVASDARAVRRTLYSSSERFPPPSSAVPAGATFLNTPVDRLHTLDTIRLHGGRSCARNPRELRVRSGAPSGRRCELRLLPGRWRAARSWSRSRSPRSR